MRRIPIRIRLGLAFAGAMAVVLALGGVLLYARMADALDRTITGSLRSQLTSVTALIKQADTGLAQGVPAASGRDTFAQVLNPDGTVLDATPQLNHQPALTSEQFRRASAGSLQVDSSIPAMGGAVRLLAAPVNAQDTRLVVVVGAPLSDRDQALASLRRELLVGGPFALAIMALAGYFLARSALRPVDRMRAETQRLSATNLGSRVSLAPADDEIRRLGMTLNGLLSRLESILERERRFVADASHELRTPLAMLSTELELALRRPRTADELTAAVRSAAAETEHLTRLAEDMLVLARSDASGLPLRLAPTSVGAMMQTVAGRFGARAEGAHRAITVDGDDAGTAIVDRTRLEQALSNLVDNALLYGRGEVSLRATREPTLIHLHVVDHGDGFAPGFLDQAFERFTRSDGARGGSGAGLGLAIVSVIAEAHGGTVQAANLPEGGAEVAIAIPT